jgi:hypothetical protein
MEAINIGWLLSITSKNNWLHFSSQEDRETTNLDQVVSQFRLIQTERETAAQFVTPQILTPGWEQ